MSERYFDRMRKIKLGLLPKEAVAKQKKPLKKVSDKRAEEIKLSKGNGDSEMDLFFNAMRKKCKGKCFFCQQGTTYKNEDLWRIAIAHLFPKSKFKSIATNENNWVELCMSCHRSFDDGTISWQLLKDSREWFELQERLFILLPLIPDHERKNKMYSAIEKLVYEK